MFTSCFFILIMGGLSLIVMMLASFLSKKTFMDREKETPFECGFDPLNSSRLPFSLRFFMIAVLFLIFDVEIALLLPLVLAVSLSSTFPWVWGMTGVCFLLILLMGLYYEWYQGALEWAG
uniref:NADH-ubiquinone oxidoreductase chain 3 n=1 Tax=Labidura japonica TaxID=761919 RepID=A0A1J0M4H3_9NEOP|nr:NADH dehydrogenase subunit 3 [Labidura japonica]